MQRSITRSVPHDAPTEEFCLFLASRSPFCSTALCRDQITLWDDPSLFVSWLLKQSRHARIIAIHEESLIAILESLRKYQIVVIPQGKRTLGIVVGIGKRRISMFLSRGLLGKHVPQGDTESVLRVTHTRLCGYQDIIRETFGVAIGSTFGVTAVRCWKTTIPPSVTFWRQRPATERLARRGYYGGMCIPRTIRTLDNVTQYDVRSMYLAMMLRGVPTGTGFAVDTEIPDRPGIYECVVTVPRGTDWPYVPFRTRSGLSYPVGTFPSTLTSIDIASARSLGITVECSNGVIWDHCEPIFDPFVAAMQGLRQTHQDTILEQLIKQTQASLYGKFGQSDTRHKIIFSSTEIPGAEPLLDARTGEIIEGFYRVTARLDSALIQVHWSAWITSLARAHLLDLIRQIGFNRVMYVDTDSCFVVGDGHVTVGPEYGELRFVQAYERWICGGPKVYAFAPGDASQFRLKGFPYADRHTVSFAGVCDHINSRSSIQTMIHPSQTVTASLLAHSVYDAYPRTLSTIDKSTWMVQDGMIVQPEISVLYS